MNVPLTTFTQVVPAILFAGTIFLAHSTGLDAHNLWLATFLVLGMPHGAYDVCRMTASGSSRSKITTELTIYLALVAAAFFVWRFQPILAIAGFLGLTAWHWGAADSYWVRNSKKISRFTFGLLRGTWVVALPLAFDFENAAMILQGMAQASSAASVSLAPQLKPLFLALGCGALVLELFFLGREKLYLAFLESLLLGLVTSAVPALLFLVAYFLGIHCWRYYVERSLEGDRVFTNPRNLLIPIGVSLVLIPLWIVIYQVPLPITSGPETTSKYLLIISCFTLPHAIFIHLQDRKHGAHAIHEPSAASALPNTPKPISSGTQG